MDYSLIKVFQLSVFIHHCTITHAELQPSLHKSVIVSLAA
jgi:hypothetical protein